MTPQHVNSFCKVEHRIQRRLFVWIINVEFVFICIEIQ